MNSWGRNKQDIAASAIVLDENIEVKTCEELELDFHN